jgi:oxygen-independent coproporphyrinogen-3 oxidase
MAVGLYVHVPFCRTRCHFCPFYLRIYRQDLAEQYLAALEQEMVWHAAHRTLAERRLATVYFGGGTPTTLKPAHLAMILQRIDQKFGLEKDAEVTVEATPQSVTVKSLTSLRGAGVNRLSFGVDSFDKQELAEVGRPSGSDAVLTAVTEARHAGFANINLDLIYGLPGQTIESWQATLATSLALEPTHLSTYALSIEQGSALWVDQRRGDTVEPDPELLLAMEEIAVSSLAGAGFTRYEISNYARWGFACRHNLLYWQGGDYLGMGPSAQSYVQGRRFGNVGNLERYSRSLDRGQLPLDEEEFLPSYQRDREALILGLRLTQGVDETRFHAAGWWKDIIPSLERMTAQGLLERSSGRLRLTGLGRRFADSVAVSLI